MAVLARGPVGEFAKRLEGIAPLPAHQRVRGPEIGLVLVRGRIGGDGAPFNLGEMTVARCTVQVGEWLGHATIAGRDLAHAELAARLDAAMQDPALHNTIQAAVVEPLAARQRADAEQESRRAAVTRVDFSTLATMRS